MPRKSFTQLKPWAKARAISLILAHGTYPNETEVDPRFNLPIFKYNKGWDDQRVAKELTRAFKDRLDGHTFSRDHIWQVRTKLVGPQRGPYVERGKGYVIQRRLREAAQAERQQVMHLEPPQREVAMEPRPWRINGGAEELQHALAPVRELLQPMFTCMSQIIEQQRMIIANQQKLLTGDSNTD